MKLGEDPLERLALALGHNLVVEDVIDLTALVWEQAGLLLSDRETAGVELLDRHNDLLSRVGFLVDLDFSPALSLSTFSVAGVYLIVFRVLRVFAAIVWAWADGEYFICGELLPTE